MRNKQEEYLIFSSPVVTDMAYNIQLNNELFLDSDIWRVNTKVTLRVPIKKNSRSSKSYYNKR